MIRALRRRHRAMVTGLALVLPVGILAGLSARPAGTAPVLPAELLAAGPEGGERLEADAWEGAALDTVLVSVNGRPGVRLAPSVDLRRPDVLVYWTPQVERRNGSTEGGVPEGAVLLGTLAGTQGRAYELPRAGGGLLLYSLAHQERLAVCALPEGD